mmetsp:Transcript_29545/g.74970  ORF Transcript_29545/g.74970 Transcript_29545/m.74970 type:complete len:200 (+) Transcript_29545:289-888(+)
MLIGFLLRTLSGARWSEWNRIPMARETSRSTRRTGRRAVGCTSCRTKNCSRGPGLPSPRTATATRRARRASPDPGMRWSRRRSPRTSRGIRREGLQRCSPVVTSTSTRAWRILRMPTWFSTLAAWAPSRATPAARAPIPEDRPLFPTSSPQRPGRGKRSSLQASWTRMVARCRWVRRTTALGSAGRACFSTRRSAVRTA